MKVYVHEGHHSDYLNRGFLDAMALHSIGTILELGANDGRDTLELHQLFGAQIHAFECHPRMAAMAFDRCRPHPEIRVVEKAVWDAPGRIPFYPVVAASQDGLSFDNPGASSCFRARDDYRQTYTQSAIEVEAVRLDAYCAEHGLDRIDLVCMDVQGAALHALRGLGARLRDVRYLVAEIENRPLYHGQSLYPEIAAHLAAHGFSPVAKVERDDWFADYLFVNEPDWLRRPSPLDRARAWLLK